MDPSVIVGSFFMSKKGWDMVKICHIPAPLSLLC